MKIVNCKVDHMINPMGFKMNTPVFSYVVEGVKGKYQQSARIVVSKTPKSEQVVADTGMTENIDRLGQQIPMALEPCTRYYWTVTVRTDANEELTSGVNWFETGKMEQPWSGRWITCIGDEERNPVFSKQFSVNDKKVEKARLYICGLGLYQAEINKKPVTEEKLTPYCNDYSTWVQYQTFDVTGLLDKENEISVMLGKGWYLGRFGFTSKPGDKGFYGDRYKLIAELHITYADGTVEVIGTDDSWRVTRSHMIFSDIYDGEIVDDTLEPLPKEKVRVLRENIPLCERVSIPVYAHEALTPIALLDTPAGEKIFDLGQNMAGGFKFQVHEPKGAKIHIQMGEVLQKGNFYRDNLRTAAAAYTYISDGEAHTLEPKFTFYGYRYVKVEGVSHLEVSDFTGIAYYSDVQPAGTFVTGDKKLNKLMDNILWGEKGNFIDVPTDCPQRDERMGWTADTQVFVPTASFLTDTYAFYNKYLFDIRHEQSHRRGCVPDVVPAFSVNSFSSVWGDAATIIPWTLYMFYGDPKILEDSIDSMKSWVDFIERTDGEDHHWREIFHYGDWLALDTLSDAVDAVRGGTDEGFIADVYYYNSAMLVAKAADVIGRNDIANAYKAKAEKILTDIWAEYYTPSGRCAVDTQTGQILSAYYRLTSNPEKAHLRLVELLKAKNNKLQTGFVGTPLLNIVLSSFGEDKLAYEIIHNETYPGWLYEINLGATTVWERWNSMEPDGSVSSTGMNSFNHYAYGAIGAWMWQTMAGINPVEHAPGFRKAYLRPVVDFKTGSLKAEYMSASGVYRVAWEVLDRWNVYIRVEIPFDCTAVLELPYKAENAIQMLEAGVYEYTYETSEPLDDFKVRCKLGECVMPFQIGS